MTTITELGRQKPSGQREGLLSTDIDPNVLVMCFYAFFNGLVFTYGQQGMELPAEWLRGAVYRLLDVKHAH